MGTPALKFRIIISFILFLAALSVFCSAETQELSILKGKKANRGQFPFMALVLSSVKYQGRNVTRRCGGAIYNEQWIITSAVCASFALDNPNLVQVYVGDVSFPSMQRVNVRRVVLDQRFTNLNYQYDIALLQLRIPLVFNSNVRPVKISTTAAVEGTYYTAGWGVTKVKNTARSDDLYYIPQVFAKASDCSRYFGRKDKPLKTFFEDTHFCTEGGKENVCAGDSGGPIFQAKDIDNAKNAVLYGLVSYGNGCRSEFNANIRIDAFACWIGRIADGNTALCESTNPTDSN